MRIRYFSAPITIVCVLGMMQTASAQIVLTAESFYGPVLGQDAVITQFIGASTADFESLLGMTGANQT